MVMIGNIRYNVADDTRPARPCILLPQVEQLKSDYFSLTLSQIHGAWFSLGDHAMLCRSMDSVAQHKEILRNQYTPLQRS